MTCDCAVEKKKGSDCILTGLICASLTGCKLQVLLAQWNVGMQHEFVSWYVLCFFFATVCKAEC